ncbi:MAG: hypothetical protein MUE88_00140 [Flavobacteriales bacterium]|jgi:hypothetical protein|nr:hypothetical protein [Flavobacteriales bacterium]
MKTRTALLFVLAGYTVITTGGLFKIMHWPSANMQLLIGATVQAVGLLALLGQVMRHHSLRALLDK